MSLVFMRRAAAIAVMMTIAGGVLPAAADKLLESVDIGPAWSGQPVGFALLTAGRRQFAAYYDAERQLTVVQRTLDSTLWQAAWLPERIDWDSHRYVTMGLDRDGRLHVSGNMHGDPLVYYRSAEPYDVTTLRRVGAMTGRLEEYCTYPRFFHGPGGELVFSYRYGRLEDWAEIFNIFDPAAQRWRRLLQAPLIYGGGRTGMYPEGPEKGPDGFWHIAWVWRGTTGCASNHDLSYARSRDLVNWEAGSGRALTLPITPREAHIVDPVPERGGLVNTGIKIGFDRRSRVIISYLKYDRTGFNQLYNARLEDGRWRVYQTSAWSERRPYEGGGSVSIGISAGPVTWADGLLTQYMHHPRHGSGTWVLDEDALRPLRPAPPRGGAVPELSRPEYRNSEMAVRRAEDLGQSPEPRVRYVLRWEAPAFNRDRPRWVPPPPVTLRVLKIGKDY